MIIFRDRFDVFIGDHAPVADEDQAAEGEPPAQIPDDLLNGRMVDAVAGPDMVGDRPAGTITTPTITWTLCGLPSRL